MKLKNLLILSIGAIASYANAQSTYPVSGVFEQVSIEGNGIRTTDIPQKVYKGHAGKYSLLAFTGNNNSIGLRAEEAPNPEDPFCQKIKVVTPDSFVLTWHNNSRGFYNYPANIWIDEEWTRVKNNPTVEAISDALTHHNAKGKLLGTWKLVSMQFPDQADKTEFQPPVGVYKIYGEKHCLMMQGSLYNIENAQRATLRNYQWNTDTEFTEAEALHKITFVSPDKFIVEYQNDKAGKGVETWIRVAVPEPMATLFSSFK